MPQACFFPLQWKDARIGDMSWAPGQSSWRIRYRRQWRSSGSLFAPRIPFAVIATSLCFGMRELKLANADHSRRTVMADCFLLAKMLDRTAPRGRHQYETPGRQWYWCCESWAFETWTASLWAYPRSSSYCMNCSRWHLVTECNPWLSDLSGCGQADRHWYPLNQFCQSP